MLVILMYVYVASAALVGVWSMAHTLQCASTIIAYEKVLFPQILVTVIPVKMEQHVKG